MLLFNCRHLKKKGLLKASWGLSHAKHCTRRSKGILGDSGTLRTLGDRDVEQNGVTVGTCVPHREMHSSTGLVLIPCQALLTALHS